MTPLEIEIMLHYYSRADDFNHGDFTYGAVKGAIEHFLVNKLLKINNALGPGKVHCISTDYNLPTYKMHFPRYEITERGRCYIEVLCSTPWPVLQQKWVMPDKGDCDD